MKRTVPFLAFTLIAALSSASSANPSRSNGIKLESCKDLSDAVDLLQSDNHSFVVVVSEGECSIEIPRGSQDADAIRAILEDERIPFSESSAMSMRGEGSSTQGNLNPNLRRSTREGSKGSGNQRVGDILQETVVDLGQKLLEKILPGASSK
jgi:hypothetical protein